MRFKQLLEVTVPTNNGSEFRFAFRGYADKIPLWRMHGLTVEPIQRIPLLIVRLRLVRQWLAFLDSFKFPTPWH